MADLAYSMYPAVNRHDLLNSLYGKFAQVSNELIPATTDPENNFDWQVQTNLTIKAKLDELRELVYSELNDEQHAVRLALRAMDDVQRYMEIAVSVMKPTGE